MALFSRVSVQRICFIYRSQTSLIRNSIAPKWNIAKPTGQQLVRQMAGGHHPKKFFIMPGTFHDWRFIYAVRWYFLIMAVPAGLAITLINIFVGSAELAEIPEGYTPKYWEYFEHPISRFIARNFLRSEQQDYEMRVHVVAMEGDKVIARKRDKKVRRLKRERDEGTMIYNYPDMDIEDKY